MNVIKTWIFVASVLSTICIPSYAQDSQQLSSELTSIRKAFSPTKNEQASGAVILREHVTYKSIGDGKLETTIHSIIALLDKLAVSDYSTIVLPYNEHYSKLSLEYARAVNPEGKITTHSADAIKITSPDQHLVYSNNKNLQFSISGLREGSIIEFKYSITDHTSLMKNDWWRSISFYRFQSVRRQPPYRIDSVRRATVTVAARKDETLSIQTAGEVKINAKQETRQDGGVTYTWDVNNLPAIPVEKSAGDLSKKLPLVRISSLDSWKKIYNWGAKYYDAQPSQEIRTLAKSITQGIVDDQKKIKTIYAYLQKSIRYLSTNFNSNGVIPHSPLTVLENHYGDCKDQSTLFASMLRAVDIEAFPALVNPYGRLEPTPEIPTLSFSHMITYVPSSSSPWIDLVGDDAVFPGLDVDYMGRKAFVFRDDSPLIDTLAQSIKDTKIEVNVDFDVQEEIGEFEIELIINGALGNRYGQYFKSVPESELTKLLASIYPRSEVVSIESGWTDTAWVARSKLIFPNLPSDNPIVISGGAGQIIYAFRRELTINETRNRKTPFIIETPTEMVLNVSILYDNAKYDLSQSRPGINTNLGDLKIDLSHKEAESKFSKMIKIGILPNTYSVSEYKLLAEEISQAATSAYWSVNLNLKNSAIKQGVRVESTRNTIGQSPSEIVDIRRQIVQSEYNAALIAIENFISNNHNNGEAHYVHGLILGFIDRYTESDAAFQKAETLGYSE